MIKKKMQKMRQRTRMRKMNKVETNGIIEKMKN